MKNLKSLFLLVCFTISSASHAAKSCLEVEVKDINSPFSIFQIKRITKSSKASVFVEINGKSKRLSGFECIKNKKGYLCVGDDDSGNFSVTSTHITIKRINWGNPDAKMIHYNPKKAKKIPYKVVNCLM